MTALRECAWTEVAGNDAPLGEPQAVVWEMTKPLVTAFENQALWLAIQSRGSHRNGDAAVTSTELTVEFIGTPAP